MQVLSWLLKLEMVCLDLTLISGSLFHFTGLAVVKLEVFKQDFKKPEQSKYWSDFNFLTLVFSSKRTQF